MEIFNLYCCFCLFIMWELKQIILSSIYVYSKICLFRLLYLRYLFLEVQLFRFYSSSIYFRKINHLSSWQIGLVNLTSPLGLVLISKITGKLISRIGNIILMTIGLIIMIVAYTNLGLLQYILNPITISLLLLLYGIGGGFSYLLILQQ